MNNKGFTLVELIAIIIIIAIVSLLSFTSLTNMLKDSNDKELSTFEESVKTAAKVYVETNIADFPGLNTTGTVKLTANTLVEKGYLKPNISNPSGYELTKVQVVITKEADKTLSYSIVYKS